MKKLLMLLAILAISATALAGPITDELNVWWGEKGVYDKANTAKAEFQTAMWGIEDQLTKIKAAYDAGEFNGLPPLSKAKAIWIYMQLDAASTAIKNDAGAMEFLGWTP